MGVGSEGGGELMMSEEQSPENIAGFIGFRDGLCEHENIRAGWSSTETIAPYSGSNRFQIVGASGA